MFRMMFHYISSGNSTSKNGVTIPLSHIVYRILSISKFFISLKKIGEFNAKFCTCIWFITENVKCIYLILTDYTSRLKDSWYQRQERYCFETKLISTFISNQNGKQFYLNIILLTKFWPKFKTCLISRILIYFLDN